MTEKRIPLGKSFDPRMIRDDQWTFRGYSLDGEFRLWTYTDPALDITIEKKEPVFAGELIKRNQERYKDSEGRRWGDGKSVADIPLNVLFSEFAGRWGDAEYTDWWLNRPENQIYRTFKGTL